MIELVNIRKFKNKLIKMNKEYPIYSREDDNPIIGYTSIGDMAIISYEDPENKDGYFETIIISGKYIGVDTLTLNLKDIMDSTFIFNKINAALGVVYVKGKEVKYEYI